LKHSPGFWRFAHEHWANAIRHQYGILGYALSHLAPPLIGVEIMRLFGVIKQYWPLSAFSVAGYLLAAIMFFLLIGKDPKVPDLEDIASISVQFPESVANGKAAKTEFEFSEPENLKAIRAFHKMILYSLDEIKEINEIETSKAQPENVDSLFKLKIKLSSGKSLSGQWLLPEAFYFESGHIETLFNSQEFKSENASAVLDSPKMEIEGLADNPKLTLVTPEAESFARALSKDLESQYPDDSKIAIATVIVNNRNLTVYSNYLNSVQWLNERILTDKISTEPLPDEAADEPLPDGIADEPFPDEAEDELLNDPSRTIFELTIDDIFTEENEIIIAEAMPGWDLDSLRRTFQTLLLDTRYAYSISDKTIYVLDYGKSAFILVFSHGDGVKKLIYFERTGRFMSFEDLTTMSITDERDIFFSITIYHGTASYQTMRKTYYRILGCDVTKVFEFYPYASDSSYLKGYYSSALLHFFYPDFLSPSGNTEIGAIERFDSDGIVTFEPPTFYFWNGAEFELGQ
jgi:hypothetical protein